MNINKKFKKNVSFKLDTNEKEGLTTILLYLKDKKKETIPDVHYISKRSKTFYVQRNFVPTLKPKKSSIIPSSFILNNEKKIFPSNDAKRKCSFNQEEDNNSNSSEELFSDSNNNKNSSENDAVDNDNNNNVNNGNNSNYNKYIDNDNDSFDSDNNLKCKSNKCNKKYKLDKFDINNNNYYNKDIINNNSKEYCNEEKSDNHNNNDNKDSKDEEKENEKKYKLKKNDNINMNLIGVQNMSSIRQKMSRIKSKSIHSRRRGTKENISKKLKEVFGLSSEDEINYNYLNHIDLTAEKSKSKPCLLENDTDNKNVIKKKLSILGMLERTKSKNEEDENKI